MKLLTYKTAFLKVSRKGAYLIWVRLKSRKAELEQRVKGSLVKCLWSVKLVATIKYLFSQTQNHYFERI